jgi:hypothetical protein
VLCSVVLGLGILWVRPEVELVRGVRVEAREGVGVRSVAGGGVGVRVVLGYVLLAGPTRRGEGASVRALLTMRGARVECSRGGETTCDG